MRSSRRALLFLTICLALGVLWVRVGAQNNVTIQASQVAAITNGTTTRTTTFLQNTGAKDVAFLLNITGAGAATGTLQVFLQDSLDGGTTFNDLAAFNTFTFGASVTTQTLNLYGSSDGPGLIRSISGTQPSAGAEISETVPTGARWELLTFKTQLVTDANVANRVVLLSLDDGSNVYYRVSANVNHAASSTFQYQFLQGFATPAISQIAAIQAPIPANNRMAGGHRIKTVTASIQVGDQYSALQYLVREWRDLPGRAQVTESFPAGQVRSGPWGDRIRVREVVSGIAGGPTGPTYTITAVYR